MRNLEFGWFLPTNGDTLDYAEPQQIPQSIEHFDKVMTAAEAAGFTYMLVPVSAFCWEAWISSAIMVARSNSITMLVAARPGYISPVMMAKMISTFDQLSGGRIAINLIAGQNETETVAEGIPYGKEERYALMEEQVRLMKAAWTVDGPVHFEGKFHTLKGAKIEPKPRQKPYPKFYLGGGSRQAWDISAAHADVHLFWGDTTERISENMAAIRALAAEHGRQDDIGFGMRLQILCRESEEEAWEVARKLVADVTAEQERVIKTEYAHSEANQRVQQLARDYGELIAPNLWTGLTKARPGAGIVIVGNPQQCAETIQRYIDIGCHSFCLSGYLHDEEATRFGDWVRPIIKKQNPGRL